MKQAEWTQYIRSHFMDQVIDSKPVRILEVGCGTGAVLSEFRDSGAELFGIDVEYDTLQIAPPGAIPNPIHGEAHILPFPANSFELVFCHYLLLWVDNPNLAINEMIRVTRPGGWVAAFAEPDYGGRIDSAGFSDNLKALQIMSLRIQQANPLMGRQLPGLFTESDLVNVQSGILGAEWKADQFHNFEHDYSVLIDDLENTNDPVTRAKLEELAEVIQNAQPGFSFVPTFYAWGKKE